MNNKEFSYACNICQTFYNTEKLATKCFKSHAKDKKCSFCDSSHKFNIDSNTYHNLTEFVVLPAYLSDYDMSIFKCYICDDCIKNYIEG